MGGDAETLLRGELSLITAVGELTDIPVQRPIKTLAGEAAARLSDGTLVSMLSWLEGTPLDQAKRTGEMLFSAGQTLARLRNAAESVVKPRSFSRFFYNQELVERLAGKIERGGEYLSPEAIRSSVKALNTVSRLMDEMDADDEVLISHADLGFGNMIWTGEAVGLIDWSLSGYAHSHMDIGLVIGATSDREEQKLLLNGWESLRGKVNRRYLDAYFALGVLLFIACQHSRAKEWADWFPAALRRWQETIFEPLSAGRVIPCIL